MADISARTLKEGTSNEKTRLTADGASDRIPQVLDTYAGVRDLLLVLFGTILSALLFFLLAKSHKYPNFITFTPQEVAPSTQRICHELPFRREWRELHEEEKVEFIDAVRCLTNKPSKLSLESTRYDDFVYVHVKLYSETHNVAPSLLWHRYYIKIFENALKQECHFQGNLPYWDWTLDAANPEGSPIWSSKNGFGGNGTKDSHCVEDGPFASFKPQYPREHCMKRDFTPGMIGFNYTQEKVLDLWENKTSYHEFRSHLESGAHKSIHNGIGGEMPTDGSPNDPIFFVHHSQIDRIYTVWQGLQLEHRLSDYSGPNNVSEPEALDQASLGDTLAMLGLSGDVTVADVMDTRSEILCFC